MDQFLGESNVRTVIKIIRVEKWVKNKTVHTRTHAILDNDEESVGYGEYKVGDQVEAYYSDKWDKYSFKYPEMR